jgi:hypothetical protein
MAVTKDSHPVTNYTDTVRSDGRLRIAGCTHRELNALAPEIKRPKISNDAIKQLLLAELSKQAVWSPRSFKLAISRVTKRHDFPELSITPVVGMDKTAVWRALNWELDTINIGYLAAALGYEINTSPITFKLRAPSSKAIETIPPAEVLKTFRAAVKAAGSRSNYALRCDGLGMCTRDLASAILGTKPIPARYLTPLGIKRQPDGVFVREVTA